MNFVASCFMLATVVAKAAFLSRRRDAVVIPEDAVEQFLEEGGILLDFAAASVVANNLGGNGPWNGTEVMRLNGVAKYQNKQIDLLIECDDGYVPNNADNNGKINSHFAQINMKKGASSTMTFTTVEHGTGNPVALPLTAITIWDFDMGNAEGKLVEQATVSPMTGFFMRSDSLVEAENVHNDTYHFYATVYGNEEDNPSDPSNLTQEQQQKLVAVVFKNTPTWNITFAVSNKGSGGRNFLFGGSIPSVPYTPMPCDNFTVFNFEQASVLHSNLAGKGPDAHVPQGIRVHNVATLNGQAVDLLVEAEEHFGPYEAYNISRNGLYGKLLNINFNSRVKVGLTFTFLQGTSPVALERFFISFFDIDMTAHGARESLEIASSELDADHGFEHYYLADNTTLKVTPDESGVYNFSASWAGDITDNPSTSLGLDGVQKSDTVTFFFKERRSSFSVDYEAGGHSWTGRNVLIGGVTKLACADL